MRLVRLVLTLLVSALPLLGTGPASGAGPDRIGLSRDGVHWAAGLTAPLFAPEIRWVPGDRRTTRFYVRNQAEDGGDLAISVERTSSEGLTGTGFLRISARTGSGPWRSIDDAGRHRLVQLADVPVGTVVAVQLRVSMAGRAPDRTMVLATELGLEVRLSESRTVVADDDGGLLPDTGNAVRPWLPVLALLLLSVGVLLTSRRTPVTPRPHASEIPS